MACTEPVKESSTRKVSILINLFSCYNSYNIFKLFYTLGVLHNYS